MLTMYGELKVPMDLQLPVSWLLTRLSLSSTFLSIFIICMYALSGKCTQSNNLEEF